MPLYEVEHRIPLSEEQRDQIAEAITRIHTTTFCTPSLFVNVKFTDVTAQCYYIAGKRGNSNRIVGQLRAGGPRTRAEFENVAAQLKAAWDDAVISGESGRSEKDMNLVVIQGSIVAALENGFQIPPAGEDVAWLKENKAAFEAIAQDGDEDFKGMVYEMNHREDLVKTLGRH